AAARGGAGRADALVLMAVLVLPSDVRLVKLDDAGQAPKSLVLHCGPDAVARVPRALIAAAPDDLPLTVARFAEHGALHLARTHALLGGEHQEQHLKEL